MNRCVKGIALAALAAGCGPGLAGERWVESEAGDEASYQLVFLHEAELEEPLNDERTSRFKTAHDHWVKSLMGYEVALAVGPVEKIAGRAVAGDEEPLKQVAIMRMESTAAALSAFEGSPSVEFGVLGVEAYSLQAAADAFARPRNLDKTELITLVLLRRPHAPPSYPQEELQRIQQGHLASIDRMRREGDLILAGELENAAGLRGILVFRSTDQRRIREQISEDPAVQAGRLELELYRWQVPRGAFAKP